MADALHVADYNFCRTHNRIKATSAREAEITNHICNLAEWLVSWRRQLVKQFRRVLCQHFVQYVPVIMIPV